jgi:hypothetical protein
MSAVEIIDLILLIFGQFLRLVGLAVLGLGIGWLVLELLKKIQAWQGQVAIFLGLAGLSIALTVFTGAGALGAFAGGVGAAFFLWGMPRKEKKEAEKK